MTTIARKTPKTSIHVNSNPSLLIDHLAKACNIQHPTDWYKISHQQVKQHQAGKQLLRQYNGSLPRALSVVYPQIDWKQWKFQNNNVPPHFWDDINNQKNFFDDFAKELNIQTEEQWYSVKLDDIERLGGGGLIHKYYGGSIMKALRAVYPDHTWVSWKFTHSPQGFWTNKQNHRQFFDWLAPKVGVQKWQDWYQVKMSDIESIAGYSEVFRKYNSSLIKVRCNIISISHKEALISVYPEHPWEVWRFEKVPKGFWKDISNVRRYFDWLADQLGIVHMADWLYVTPESIPRMLSVIREHHGFMNLLKRLYPEFSWDSQPLLVNSSISSTSKTLLKTQKLLAHIVKQLFANTEVYTDYKHPRLMYSHTNRYMQFDIFLPELQIAFEYQGQQHYYWNYLRGEQSTQQSLDQEKKQACTKAGITLIEVPFWWDRSRNSILGTLLKAKPDVVPYLSSPIPASECLRSIPDAPSKKISDSIAHRGQNHKRYVPQWMAWHQDADPSSWWVSAIRPGIRILYDGHKFSTPSGVEVIFPESVSRKILPQLPKSELDLYLSFQNDQLLPEVQHKISSHSNTSSLIDLSSMDLERYHVVFSILDSPAEISMFFEQRINTILSMMPHLPPQLDDLGIQHMMNPTDAVTLHVCDGIQIQDRNHFNEIIQTAKQNNVPGLLLRKSNAPYTADGGWHYYQVSQQSGMIPTTTKPRYVLSRGSSRGKPRCRGCGKFIPSQQPRVLVSGSFTPLSSFPFTANYQICLDEDCIEKAVVKYSTNKDVGYGATLPPFDSIIGVEKQLLDLIPQLQQDHKHIKWIEITESC